MSSIYRIRAAASRTLTRLRARPSRGSLQLAADSEMHGNALEQHALRIDELTRIAETMLHRLDGLESAQLELQRDVALRITRIAARLGDYDAG